MKKVVDELFHPKRILALITLLNGETYYTELARRVNSSPNNLYNIIKLLKRMDLVETRREGRKMVIKLTDRGKVLANRLKEALEVVL